MVSLSSTHSVYLLEEYTTQGKPALCPAVKNGTMANVQLSLKAKWLSDFTGWTLNVSIDLSLHLDFCTFILVLFCFFGFFFLSRFLMTFLLLHVDEGIYKSLLMQ